MTHEYIDPTRAQFGAFAALPQDTPIAMLNLVRLRATALVEGVEHTGAEAYRQYSKRSAPVLERVGGHVEWSGGFEAVLIGPEDERWDLVFIARYPSAAAFIEMVRDPDYGQAVVWRAAAVETSRLIRLKPGKTGVGFG